MPRTTPATLKDVQAHFQGLSERWGYPIDPPEALVNSLGYLALQRRDVGKPWNCFASTPARIRRLPTPRTVLARRSNGPDS